MLIEFETSKPHNYSPHDTTTSSHNDLPWVYILILMFYVIVSAGENIETNKH